MDEGVWFATGLVRIQRCNMRHIIWRYLYQYVLTNTPIAVLCEMYAMLVFSLARRGQKWSEYKFIA